MDSVRTKQLEVPAFQKGHPDWARALTDAIRRDHEHADRDVTLFAEHAIEAKQNAIWKLAIPDEPKTWERYCSDCLQLPPTYVEAVIVGVSALKGIGISGPIPADMAQRASLLANTSTALMTPTERASVAGKVGGGGRPKQLHYNYNVAAPKQGTNPDYLTARIARDRPDILSDMKAGKYRSVRQAAIAAGIVKDERRLSIPYDPPKAAAVILRNFTTAQVDELIDALTRA